MRRIGKFSFMFLLIAALAIGGFTKTQAQRAKVFYQDQPFIQEYSIKYDFDNSRAQLIRIGADRNGYIQAISTRGLLRPKAGQFLFPGTFVKDVQYLPTSDKGVRNMIVVDNQLVYIDDKAVFSNAWSGRLYSRHNLPEARMVAAGKDFTFMISDSLKIHLLKDSKTLWEGKTEGKVKDIKYDAANDQFWILSQGAISVFPLKTKKTETVVKNASLTSIEVAENRLIAGTTDGYFEIDTKTKKQVGEIQRKLPWTEITTIEYTNGELWFGSTWGAFKRNNDGKYSYYASKRWLPSDKVIDITAGPENSVLVLTDKGLGKICRQEMTLYDKAMYFEKQVRERHLRHGFNAEVTRMTDGDVTSGSVEDSDNDGLWTSMYLAAEVFRYKVTNSEEALLNIRESLDAMDRLYTINEVPGFPSRSFERRGYKYHDEPWRRANDAEWDWKSTTSSDEAIGHIFVFGTIAELVDVPELKNKAIELIDTLMSHTLKNNFYMVDWDGKPTRWARWNPEYVNARPVMVGDRKINASNYIAMLQTAYHFTKKEKYKEAAFYLMKEHGYFTNMMRPMNQVGYAPADADELSRELSDGWNHSDDEMYYCGYWGLYRYALNDTLKAHYKNQIVDHWQSERPEKEGLWNIMTALVGDEDYDFDNAVWYLQKYPLDLINWSVKNSHRKDIVMMEPNFRRQTITEILPASELRISRHNANRFDLDSQGEGRSEDSAGDIWLLPYWMGRYLNVIGEPESK